MDRLIDGLRVQRTRRRQDGKVLVYFKAEPGLPRREPLALTDSEYSCRLTYLAPSLDDVADSSAGDLQQS
jgi:hypothetical protein